MNTFYKYIKNLGTKAFIEPKVKISNNNYLNDPFESEAGENLIENIFEGLTRAGDKYVKSEITKSINESINSYGVFSVSETPRNILMWAHYGNEHRGICIGYNKNIFSKVKHPDKSGNLLSEYTPKKVNYDNYRFDTEFKIYNPENLVIAVKSHLFTKSDEWIYEKEHRCIIPAYCASHFYHDQSNSNTKSNLDSTVSIDAVLAHGLESKQIKKITENEYKITCKEEDKLAITTALSSFECIYLLYEIEHKNIESIHLGMRISNQETIKYYNMINSGNVLLSHVKLYRFALCKKRFELIPEIVDAEYISKITSS